MRETSKRGRSVTCFFAALVLVGNWAVSSPARGAADQSYQALVNWLEHYREAPATFEPGHTLGFQDRHALEPFIPQSAWAYYFFEAMEMEIAATGDYPPPPEWGHQVVPGYALDAQGVLVDFQGGGFPFPDIAPADPQIALKVIWNMLWRPGQDDYMMPMVAWSRSEYGQLDREFEFTAVNAEYARGTHCLVPGYEEVRRKSLMEFRSPRDMTGAKNLSITYVDHYKEDSGWTYLPAQRKPRRTLASERTSEMMGMDFTPEDMMGFGGKIYEQEWTYLGRKPVLATINVATNPEAGGPHLWVPHKARWEVRDTHVLQIDPKSETHPYSHKIVFIDTETYWTHWMVAFDRRDDKLLRLSQHFLKYSESYAEEPARQAPYLEQDFSKNVGHQVFLHVGETSINAKKPHATYTHCYVLKRTFSPGRAKQFYSLRNMVSGRR